MRLVSLVDEESEVVTVAALHLYCRPLDRSRMICHLQDLPGPPSTPEDLGAALDAIRVAISLRAWTTR